MSRVLLMSSLPSVKWLGVFPILNEHSDLPVLEARESSDLSGCGGVGRKRACKEWWPATAGWSRDRRPAAEGWPRRPGPTRGRRCGQTGAVAGERPGLVSCCPGLCPHYQVGPTCNLNMRDHEFISVKSTSSVRGHDVGIKTGGSKSACAVHKYKYRSLFWEYRIYVLKFSSFIVISVQWQMCLDLRKKMSM